MCSLQTKNQAIKEAIAKTKNRRKSQVCRTFEVKVIGNKLSQEKKEHFNALFREAKWLRNAVIGSGDPFAFDSATKSVPVKRGDIFEEATFTAISAQMKQNIVDSVKSEIYGLATKKRKGEKVGALRFKAFCNSIPLRQYGMTYRVDFVNNTVIIQNLKKPVKVRGLGQIQRMPKLQAPSSSVSRRGCISISPHIAKLRLKNPPAPFAVSTSGLRRI